MQRLSNKSYALFMTSVSVQAASQLVMSVVGSILPPSGYTYTLKPIYTFLIAPHMTSEGLFITRLLV